VAPRPLLAVAGAMVVLLAAVAFFHFRPAAALTESDYILLTDIVNTTDDPVFDGTLQQALAVKLEESPYLNVVSGARIRETLRFIDLSGWAEKITCSLYLQHGMKDDLIPFEQARRLEREAVNAREVVTQYEPDGIHCCHNLAHRSRHPMADHLAKVLKG
ncbi:MAG: alpha/beta hydrolase family protein, partial [Nitrospinota bacterium]